MMSPKNRPSRKRLIFIAIWAGILTKGTAHLVSYLGVAFPIYAVEIKHVLGLGSVVLICFLVVRPFFEELGYKNNIGNSDDK